MRVFDKNLKEDYPVGGGVLTCMLADNSFDDAESGKNWSRPAVIVVPGGSYRFVSKREGQPVAECFLAEGFQTFVLTYQTDVDGARYPDQLCQLSCAVDLVRKRADEFHVQKDNVFVIGFSAGGHLVANLSNETTLASEVLGVALDCKPTAVALGYPVVNGHDESFDNLLRGYEGRQADELRRRLQLDELVSNQTPPTFVWTTAQDRLVPSQNSLCYALALANCGVPYELHVFPFGDHGKSTGGREINGERDDVSTREQWQRLATWTSHCAAFFRAFVK